MKHLLFSVLVYCSTICQLFSQPMEAVFSKWPDGLESAPIKLLTKPFKIKVIDINQNQKDELLSNSTFKGKMNDSDYDKKLSDINAPAKINYDSSKEELTISVTDVLADMQERDGKMVLTLKKDTDDPGVVYTITKEKNVASDKSVSISSELFQNTTPEFIFITKDMFIETGGFDLTNVSNSLKVRNRGDLSGDYILLYDFRKGDYDAYKRVIRKNPDTPNLGKPYLEFYKQKRAAHFSPLVGSQFKVEILNFTNLIPINVEIEQTDNFLADGARFGTLISTFNANNDKIGKPAEEPPAAGSQESLTEDSLLVLLIMLRNDLNYYHSHFQYSSFTASKHEENLKYIKPIIVTKFGFETVDLVAEFRKLASDDRTKDPNAKTAIAQIILSLNQILNYKVIAFSTFKLKDRDNLIIKFKDDQNRIVKEEEIHISNGFKIDFSSGVFLTGLKDDNYVFKDTTVKYRTFESSSDTVGTLTDTNGNYILKEKTSPAKLNFGVMMHGYPRLSSNYNLGLTVGISTNTNLDLNLLAGGSVMLGSERRIVLSGGWVWGKATRISNTVHPGFRREGVAADELENKPVFYSADDNVVPSAPSDWYRSWFFGVSFNLTRK